MNAGANAGASSRSTLSVVTSSSNENLERVLLQIERLTQPLLNVVKPQAPHATVVVEAQKAAAESEHKMRLITNLAARIQAFSSVQKSAEGDNIDKVRQKIADLTTEMLQVDN